jgi:hypothetical protein
MRTKQAFVTLAGAMLASAAFAGPHAGGSTHGSGSVNAGAMHPGSPDSNGAAVTGRNVGLDRAMERRSDMGNLNANNPGSPNRATGTERAADRKAMRTPHATTTTRTVRDRTGRNTAEFHASTTREQRMDQARSDWERNTKR